ncbi:AcrR family transcriptional regulator [Paraburkholderia sp. GAS448]|uniref:TetR/AcrR family transcriptional regulator n=1 Tax=Paraburkholderia sp. GAS448 TaxID=3035136 RepID=UPI003D23A046
MKQLIITAEDMSATNSAGETRRRGNRTTRVPEILEISINAFATDGYAAFNQRRVASEAGLRLSTLQHYFRTREDLLRATVEAMGDRYLDLYRKLSRDSSLTPLARLDKIADETFNALARPNSNFSAFAIELWSLAEHEDFARDLLEEITGQNLEIFAGLVSKINPELSSEDCALRGALLTSNLQGLLIFVRRAGKNTPDLDGLRAMTKVVWRALSTAPGSS